MKSPVSQLERQNLWMSYSKLCPLHGSLVYFPKIFLNSLKSFHLLEFVIMHKVLWKHIYGAYFLLPVCTVINSHPCASQSRRKCGVGPQRNSSLLSAHSVCFNIFRQKCCHTSYLSRTPRTHSCKFFLTGVNFYRFNAKNWQFTVYFAVITQKIGDLLCILS